MANQECMRLAPGMFELGAAGYSRPTRDTWTDADLPALREAEENCPTAAIVVEALSP
jgi:ferredoxin